VLDAIAGRDPADPTTSERPFRYDDAAVDARRFRFAVLRNATVGCDDAVRENFARSLEVLRRIGTVDEVALPDLPWEIVTRTILHVESASAFEDLIESGGIAGLTAPEDRYTAYARDAILAKDYVRALRLRGVMARDADALLASFDALIGPGRPGVAPPLGREFRSALGSSGVPDILGAVGNGAGLPAVIVPNGFGDRGLPTSIQFVGRAWEENTVLAAARVYQSLTDWHTRHPDLDR
jgi:aspartyl-tRNA(Asn)/glutamyl-tRNA(Gln) amidotransferase subunit A